MRICFRPSHCLRLRLAAIHFLAPKPQLALRVQGPHFVDWQALASSGARAMAAIPIYCCKTPVAVLNLASSQPCAFASACAPVLLAAVMAPHVASLRYQTRRDQLTALVQHELTPLVAELSVQQGRFKRVKNTCGEEVLCLDESRGLDGSRLPARAPVQVRSCVS